MNAAFLANQAVRQASKLEGALSKAVLEQVALAHVAAWVDQQDETTPPAAVLSTARAAINRIRAHYAA